MSDVREPDGLAHVVAERVPVHPRSAPPRTCLFAASARPTLVRAGERDAATLVGRRRGREVEREPLASLDYAAVVDDETFEDVGTRSPPRPRAGRRDGSGRRA